MNATAKSSVKWRGWWDQTLLGVRWAIVLLITGLITSVGGCVWQRLETDRASLRTYNLSRVAEFRDSGARLDEKVAAFNDAVAENQSTAMERAAVRQAFSEHAAKLEAMKEVMPEASSKAYTADLRYLQKAIESTSDAANAGTILTAMSRVVVARRMLAQTVTTDAIG